MRLVGITTLALLIAVTAWAASRSVVARFVPVDGELTVSYTILKNEKLLESALDALRAGKTLRVTHVMELKPMHGWRRKTLARKKVSRYLKFNPLENRYYAGFDLDSMLELLSEDMITGQLYSVEGVPLTSQTMLETGDEYELSITVRYNVEEGGDSSWLEFFSLREMWTTDEISEEVGYIAR